MHSSSRPYHASSPAGPITLIALMVSLLLLSVASVRGDIVVPGANGSDNDLIITNNTVIDLSQAISAPWDVDNSANAGRGVYDSNKWAVVFKYKSVHIASNATVTFKNHASRAPVVWLVSGDVVVHGVVSLGGQFGATAPNLAEPGPGGARGGMGYFSPGVIAGNGFGIGGGNRGDWGAGGSYGTAGYPDSSPRIYGNPSLVPLIGGSGGGGYSNSSQGGGGGGGALLIASQSKVEISGTVHANGGGSLAGAAGGSGGAIRIVCRELTGSGNVSARSVNAQHYGGLGRIRIERAVYTGTLVLTPDPSIVSLADASSSIVWPPSNAPTVEVVSVGSSLAPKDPRSEFGGLGADIALPQTSRVRVEIETKNVEDAAQVLVRSTPRSGGARDFTAAAKSSIVSDDPLTLRWVADVPVGVGYSALQVHVIRP